MKFFTNLKRFIPKKLQYKRFDFVMKGENSNIEIIELNNMLANPYQPIRKYQFLIDFENNVIDSYVVKSFSIDGSTNDFYLEVYVPVEKSYEYKDVKKITIKWLDAAGVVVTRHNFELEFDKLWYNGDYAESKLLTINLKYKIKNYNL